MSWLDTLEGIRTKNFKKATAKEREKACRDVLNMCSYASAVIAVSPIPFSDVLLMLPVQTAMVMTVGHIQGRKINEAAARDLLLELGAIAGVGILARQGIKALLPVFGALLTVPAAFAANWAMGRAAMEYFRNPTASRETLREVYQEAKREGAGLFSRVNFDAFRSKSEGAVGDVVEPKPKGGAAKKKRKAPPKVMTARWVVEEELPGQLEANEAAARKLGARVHLDVSGKGGGQWTVNLASKSGFVNPGHLGKADLSVSCDGPTFLRLVDGKLDAPTAVFMGALVIEPPDADLAGKIAALLKRPIV